MSLTLLRSSFLTNWVSLGRLASPWTYPEVFLGKPRNSSARSIPGRSYLQMTSESEDVMQLLRRGIAGDMLNTTLKVLRPLDHFCFLLLTRFNFGEYLMKVRTCFSMIAVMVIGLFSSVYGQEADQPPSVYAVVNYMKSAEGKKDDYKELATNVWKKVHQARVKDGAAIGWYFHEVTNGPDDSQEYDFVTVDLYDSFAKVENPYPAKCFAGLSSDEIDQLRNSGSVRTLIRSELWHVEAAAMGKSSSKAKYSVVHYMKPTPGNVGKYASAERNIFQKLQQHRVDERGLSAWFFAGRRFPGGSGEYEHITLSMFENEDHPKDGWDNEASESIAPVYKELSEEQQEVVKSIGELRTIVKGEVWKLLDSVSSEEN